MDYKYNVCRFKNINGITCYINSILHILQIIPHFTDYILSLNYNENNNKTCIYELFKIIKTSLNNDNFIINPRSFFKKIGIINKMWAEPVYQDSQEFLSFLISKIQEEDYKYFRNININEFYNSQVKIKSNYKLVIRNINTLIGINEWNNYEKFEYSLLKKIFNGIIINNKICKFCNYCSIKYDIFITLQLDIPIKCNLDYNKSFSIYDCLDHLIQYQQVDKNNKLLCNLCGIKNKSKYNSLLWKMPEILIIQIKRFNNNNIKIKNNILYPKILDLHKYFDNNSPYINESYYELIGINIHIDFDNTINNGHYVSIVKNNNRWLLYDDDNNIIHINNIQNSNAYLLFYKLIKI
jgi:ubiquitin C-terminal hydrolase